MYNINLLCRWDLSFSYLFRKKNKQKTKQENPLRQNLILPIPYDAYKFYVFVCVSVLGYGPFSVRLIGSAMFGAIFKLASRVGLP